MKAVHRLLHDDIRAVAGPDEQRFFNEPTISVDASLPSTVRVMKHLEERGILEWCEHGAIVMMQDRVFGSRGLFDWGDGP